MIRRAAAYAFWLLLVLLILADRQDADQRAQEQAERCQQFGCN